MNLVQCTNGHFYYAEKYRFCLHCGVASRKENINKNKTIQPEDIELHDDAVFVWEIV